jgi:DNA helicase-2/ATP-dependent DNA helicase PcrA
MQISLSIEQRAVVEFPVGQDDDGVTGLFVSACPGAGKTLAVVERFISHSQGLARNQGMAILSFSRVAASEVARGCHERQLVGLLEFPHFVGTLDSFFIRHFFLPLAQIRRGGRVRVLDSWESIGAYVHLKGENAQVPLDAFPYDGSSVRFDELRLHREFYGLRKTVAARQSDWEKAAYLRWKHLKGLGFRTCDDMRLAVAQTIADPRWAFVLRALAGRYHEVIVDEAQDCDESQVAVLQAIRDAGVRVTVVADIDQAIYEFRKATPSVLGRLTETMTPLRMKDNRRGSPAVCAIANSMVDHARADTKSAGDTMNCEWPVLVVPYVTGGEREACIGFCARAKELKCEEVLVVAHSRALALRAAGRDVTTGQQGGGAGRLVAAAVRMFSGVLDAKGRLAAIREAEKVLLRRLGIALDDRGVEEACANESIERRWLRGSAYALLRELKIRAGGARESTAIDAVTWARQAVAAIKDAPAGRAWMRSGSTLFHSPQNAKAKVTFVTSSEREPGVLVNTIHGVKGEGKDVVLLILPSDVASSRKLLSAWRTRSMADEANRVAYVAVTRTKRLLGLAVPEEVSGDLTTILDNAGVPNLVLDAPPAPKVAGRRARARRN